jgi:protein-tyrosine phosphatase
MERLVLVDSAGTHDYHAGEAPDPRTQAAARKRGYDLSGLRSRPIHADDLRKFDHLLAMDEGHLTLLRRNAPADHQANIRLFLEYAPQLGHHNVPDPYYGGEEGFEIVLDLIEEASRGLVRHLVREARVQTTRRAAGRLVEDSDRSKKARR